MKKSSPTKSGLKDDFDDGFKDADTATAKH